MNKKNFNRNVVSSAIIWAAFAFLAWYAGQDLGTIATLGGIALMFAWMYEQNNIKN